MKMGGKKVLEVRKYMPILQKVNGYRYCVVFFTCDVTALPPVRLLDICFRYCYRFAQVNPTSP